VLRAKKKEVSWKPFVSRLRKLNKAQIEELASGFPQEWLGHAGKVYTHILGVVEHVKDFELELRRSLL